MLVGQAPALREYLGEVAFEVEVETLQAAC